MGLISRVSSRTYRNFVKKKNVKMPKAKKQSTTLKFTIDCTSPIEDGIMEIASFNQYLKDRIKINGKVGQLANQVTVTNTKNTLTVESSSAFSKRYLKYLS